MAKITLNVEGGNPPYTVQIREIGESSGNRCINCSDITSLSNLDVDVIQDGISHTYSGVVSNSNCHDGPFTFNLTCSCPNTPTFSMNSTCVDGASTLYATPTIVGGGSVRVIITRGSSTIYDAVVTSGQTIELPADNNTTYSGYAQLSNTCRSSTVTVTTVCEPTCTLSVTVTNVSCS